jgi:hypothetical protein
MSDTIARVAAEHDLKIWPEPFQAVLAGDKTAEFRRERGDEPGSVDRLFDVGDVLVLREYDPEKEHPETGCRVGGYTGRVVRRVITHRLGSLFEEQFGIPAGYVMLSIAPEAPPYNRAEREGEGKGEYPHVSAFIERCRESGEVATWRGIAAALELDAKEERAAEQRDLDPLRDAEAIRTGARLVDAAVNQGLLADSPMVDDVTLTAYLRAVADKMERLARARSSAPFSEAVKAALASIRSQIRYNNHGCDPHLPGDVLVQELDKLDAILASFATWTGDA